MAFNLKKVLKALLLSSSQPLSIKEISHGGCLVETSFPLHLNSLHDIRLTLGDQSVVLKGRVAHCRITDVEQEIVHYRSGVEFIEPSERVRIHSSARRSPLTMSSIEPTQVSRPTPRMRRHAKLALGA